MTYYIKYLAINIIGNLEVCNVRYILSYNHQIMNFKPETQLSIVFYYRVSIEWMLNYGLKSQQMVLHANLQSEVVQTIFTIFFGGGGRGVGGNHIQQLIILKVIMIDRRCLQFWNSQVIIFSNHGM